MRPVGVTTDFRSALRPPRVRPGDVIAGVSVALILIPQSLAYAEIAGLPAFFGLFAAALPPIAASIIASSPYLQTGPVAMTSLLTFGALSAMAEPFSAEYVALAALLAILVGVIRMIIGLVGAGVVAYFMSRPVLVGFTSAAALLIIASQLPTALGAGATPAGGLLYRAGWALAHPGSWETASVVIAGVVVATVMISRRIHPLMPGVVIAVAGGLLFSIIADYGGPTIGELPGGLPPFSLALPWSDAFSLVLAAGVIALVGFAEPAAIARVYAAKDRQRWDASQEFMSQGLANIASGISGGFPVGGSFSRTSVGRLSGARTRWSGFITGMAVFAFIPLAFILEPLPRAVLSAIVIAAVVPIAQPRQILAITRYSRAQGSVAVSTFVLTLALAPRIDQAVIIGIGLGIMVHLIRELRVDVQIDVEGETLRIAPGGVLYFASAEALNERLLELMADHPEAKELIIDLEGLGRVDYTGAVTLKSLADEAADAGLDVRLVAVPARTRRIIESVWNESPPALPTWRDVIRRLR